METANAIIYVISNDKTAEETQHNPPERSSASSISVTSVPSILCCKHPEKRGEWHQLRLYNIWEERFDREGGVLLSHPRQAPDTTRSAGTFLTKMLGQLLARTQRILVIQLRTLYFPYALRQKIRISGSSTVLGRNLLQVHNTRDSAELKEYWLDHKTTGTKRRILKQVSEIKVKWIITTDHGPLHYEQYLNVDANEEGFEPPNIFKTLSELSLACERSRIFGCHCFCQK